MNQIAHIRQEEKKYHDLCYEQYKLFEAGSWLHKPVKTVMDMMSYFEGKKQVKVLDLGSGVGRNSIPIAQKILDNGGKVTCVDLLDSALTKLIENSKEHRVLDVIEIIKTEIENYDIDPESYDYIVAVSSLEHVQTKEAFEKVLLSMKHGTKHNGVNCLIVNTNLQEIDLATNEELDALIEINLSTDIMLNTLKNMYEGWKEIHIRVKNLTYNIMRNNKSIQLKTNAVTFVVQNV
ncbi:class I SAM-dependent methyltransferase [Bacillus sp. Xin]|uniref:class I SAM-dependent methyltransferase n=1 Tax=unclassified Bacillus (in: firmicutes) TaxID=185979 RepID=UPI001574E1FB|nr:MULTISPECIES: class I SAM-dependent methyltransferase [unclassified Bacillus (in: firmicutes)]MBC6973328.1 class I SAM-dependent methyltransferase [Bacillus sp. Xin]NSW35669.1 class I SAM-dependent methyltransferase [Bacillus sp. Xin1]